MKRTLIALLALTLTLTALAAPPRPGANNTAPAPGGPAGPQPQRGPGGPGGPGGILSPEALAEFLSLTEAQLTQIESLRDTLQATMEPLREQQRANHEAIETALAAGNAGAAGTAMLANYNLRAQMKAAQDAFKAGFESVLTPEQKARWTVYQEIVDLARPARPRD